MSELLEIEQTYELKREAAAEKLRELADSLSRHNEVEFIHHGKRITVDIPDDVELEIDLEIEDGDNEIEVKISW